MSLRAVFAGILAGLSLVGVVLAQSGLSREVRPPAVAGEGMSAEQMVTEAERLLEGMRSAMSEGFEQLQSAREGTDVQRIACVNESMTAIKGLVRLGEQSYVSLREAAVRGESHGVQHEFVKLSLASAKAAEMRTQLGACGGIALSTEADGEAELEVLTDADMMSYIGGLPGWFSATEVVLPPTVATSPFF